MITAEEINRRLEAAIKASGKTRSQIAEESGVSINAVSRGCYKWVVPRSDTLAALCEVLHISTDWVLGQRDRICADALAKYGFNKQLLMLFEEMAELQNALCKERLGRDTVEHIAEEIADVKIMLDQMEIYYGIRDEVQCKRRGKLERLQERMNRNEKI